MRKDSRRLTTANVPRCVLPFIYDEANAIKTQEGKVYRVIMGLDLMIIVNGVVEWVL
jgi:hypothetical protein